MTNGENLKNIYPDLEIISEIKDVYVIMLEAHNVWSPKLEVFKSWWNAEYKEPSNSTSSDTKNETLVSLGVYKQVAKERDIAIEQLHELGYEFGIKIPDIKYHSHHCVDRRLVEALVHKYLKEGTDDHIAFYEELLDLPLVTPQEPSINDTLNKIKTKIALLKHLNTGLTVYRWWNNAIDNCLHEIDYYITENEVEE